MDEVNDGEKAKDTDVAKFKIIYRNAAGEMKIVELTEKFSLRNTPRPIIDQKFSVHCPLYSFGRNTSTIYFFDRISSFKKQRQEKLSAAQLFLFQYLQ